MSLSLPRSSLGASSRSIALFDKKCPQPTGVHDVLDERLLSCKGVYEVQGESAPLAAALALEKPRLLSKQMIRLYLVCIVAYLSISFLKFADLDSCINGYDALVPV